jgi:FkbM family methyltransferase
MDEKMIYDVGMHTGEDTAYYLHRGFKVIAIEANPELCQQAHVRFTREINEGRLVVLNIAIAREEGSAEFWICDGHTEWSSFHESAASRDGLPHHSIKVTCQPFDSILSKFGIPYYIKIDIESSDIQCLESLRKVRDLPKYISCELGDFSTVVKILEELQFSGYKLISQYNFLPVELERCRRRINYDFWDRVATDRSFIARAFRKSLRLLKGENMIYLLRDLSQRERGWRFRTGSSGAFGESTAGRWRSGEEVQGIYFRMQDLRKRGMKSPFWKDKEYSFWVDLHARR